MWLGLAGVGLGLAWVAVSGVVCSVGSLWRPDGSNNLVTSGRLVIVERGL
jgi:hypothetical protein